MLVKQYVFFGLFSGFFVMMAVYVILHFFKGIDRENGLPEKTGNLCLCIGFVSGIAAVCVSPEPMMILLFDIFFAYILVMAYTDYYVKQLYTFASMVVFLIGIMVCFMQQSGSFYIMTVYTGFMLLMVLIRLFAIGDFFLLIAGMPYLIFYGTENGYLPGYILALHFLLSMTIIVFAHGWRLLRKGGKKILAAYAPANYIAAMVTMIMGRIFDLDKLLNIII